METKKQFEERKKTEKAEKQYAKKMDKVRQNLEEMKKEWEKTHKDHASIQKKVEDSVKDLKDNPNSQYIYEAYTGILTYFNKQTTTFQQEIERKTDFRESLNLAGFKIGNDVAPSNTNQIENIGRPGDIANKQFKEYEKLGIVLKIKPNDPNSEYQFNKNTWDIHQSGQKIQTVKNDHTNYASYVVMLSGFILYIGAAMAAENGINSIQDPQAIILMVGGALLIAAIAYYMAGESNSSGRANNQDLQNLIERRENITNLLNNLAAVPQLGSQRFNQIANERETLLTGLSNPQGAFINLTNQQRADISGFHALSSMIEPMGEANFRRMMANEEARNSIANSVLNTMRNQGLTDQQINDNRTRVSKMLLDYSSGKPLDFGKININGKDIDINQALIANIIKSKGRLSDLETNNISIDGKKTIGDVENDLKKNDILKEGQFKEGQSLESVLKDGKVDDLKKTIDDKIKENNNKIKQNQNLVAQNNSEIGMNTANIRDANNKAKEVDEEIKKTKEKLTKNTKELDELQKANNKDSQIGKVSDATKAKNEKINELQAKQNDLEKDIKDKSEDNTKRKENIKNMQDKNNKLDGENKKINDENTNLQDKNKDLNKLKTDVDAAKTANDNVKEIAANERKYAPPLEEIKKQQEELKKQELDPKNIVLDSSLGDDFKPMSFKPKIEIDEKSLEEEKKEQQPEPKINLKETQKEYGGLPQQDEFIPDELNESIGSNFAPKQNDYNSNNINKINTTDSVLSGDHITKDLKTLRQVAPELYEKENTNVDDLDISSASAAVTDESKLQGQENDEIATDFDKLKKQNESQNETNIKDINFDDLNENEDLTQNKSSLDNSNFQEYESSNDDNSLGEENKSFKFEPSIDIEDGKSFDSNIEKSAEEESKNFKNQPQSQNLDFDEESFDLYDLDGVEEIKKAVKPSKSDIVIEDIELDPKYSGGKSNEQNNFEDQEENVLNLKDAVGEKAFNEMFEETQEEIKNEPKQDLKSQLNEDEVKGSSFESFGAENKIEESKNNITEQHNTNNIENDYENKAHKQTNQANIPPNLGESTFSDKQNFINASAENNTQQKDTVDNSKQKSVNKADNMKDYINHYSKIASGIDNKQSPQIQAWSSYKDSAQGKEDIKELGGERNALVAFNEKWKELHPKEEAKEETKTYNKPLQRTQQGYGM